VDVGVRRNAYASLKTLLGGEPLRD